MRTLIAGVSVCALISVSASGPGYGDKIGQAYVTAPIERGSIDKAGTVNAVVRVELGSQLSGQGSEVLANFNDPVKAGQVVARINPESYIAVVTEAKAALKIARAAARNCRRQGWSERKSRPKARVLRAKWWRLSWPPHKPSRMKTREISNEISV